MILISIMLNSMFLNSNNPLMMGIILITQTLMLMILMGKMNLTFWLSFIIFLVYVGGMMVLFFYVISLLNNSNISHLKFNKMMFFLFLFSMMFLNMNNYNNNLEMMIFFKINHLNYENSIVMMKLYNMPNLIINLMLIIYLFIMMVVICKVTNYIKGPYFKF